MPKNSKLALRIWTLNLQQSIERLVICYKNTTTLDLRLSVL
jgi:hypothetical protein